MQDLSQLSLEQLQQLKQEKEQEKNQIYQECLRRIEIIKAYNSGYYKGTEINKTNSIEYKAESYEMSKKYEALETEIQEIDLLMAQYQNSTNKPSNEDSKEKLTLAQKAKLEALKNALLSAPPPTKPNQPKKCLKA